MKPDIALAGFLLTADEWDELDLHAREELVTASIRRDEPWQVRRASGLLAADPAPATELNLGL